MGVDPSIDELAGKGRVESLQKFLEHLKADATFAESADAKRQAEIIKELQAALATKRQKMYFPRKKRRQGLLEESPVPGREASDQVERTYEDSQLEGLKVPPPRDVEQIKAYGDL